MSDNISKICILSPPYGLGVKMQHLRYPVSQRIVGENESLTV